MPNGSGYWRSHKYCAQGTIFRLALRNDEQASRSKLSTRPQTAGVVANMLEEFASGLSLVLLFLRNVAKISIYEWQSGNLKPTCLHVSSVQNMTQELQLKRALKATSYADAQLDATGFSRSGTFFIL